MANNSRVDVVIFASGNYKSAMKGGVANGDTKRGASANTAFSANTTAMGLGAANAFGLTLDMELEFQARRLAIVREGNANVGAVNREFRSTQTSWDRASNIEKLKMAESVSSALLSTLDTFMGLSGKKNKAMFNLHKAVSMAEAIISAHAGAARAYKDFPGPIAPVMSALALARGYAQAVAISRTNIGSKAGGGSSAGGGSVNPPQGTSSPPYGASLKEQRKGAQRLVVNIYNPLSDENWQKVVEDNIIPALEEAQDRNVTLKLNN